MCALGTSKHLRCRRTSGERVRSEFETNCHLQQHPDIDIDSVQMCPLSDLSSTIFYSSDVSASREQCEVKAATRAVVAGLNSRATAVSTAG